MKKYIHIYIYINETSIHPNERWNKTKWEIKYKKLDIKWEINKWKGYTNYLKMRHIMKKGQIKYIKNVI